MVEIEDLKDKLAYIEREKIAKIEEDITEIKMNQVETHTLVKEFSKAMDTVTSTMLSMKEAMQDISLNMRDNSNSINELNQKFTCFEETTNKEMSEVKDKLEIQGNVFGVFIKDNVWQIVSFISVASIVAYLVIGKIL